jgi:hypothetical protein
LVSVIDVMRAYKTLLLDPETSWAAVMSYGPNKLLVPSRLSGLCAPGCFNAFMAEVLSPVFDDVLVRHMSVRHMSGGSMLDAVAEWERVVVVVVVQAGKLRVAQRSVTLLGHTVEEGKSKLLRVEGRAVAQDAAAGVSGGCCVSGGSMGSCQGMAQRG